MDADEITVAARATRRRFLRSAAGAAAFALRSGRMPVFARAEPGRHVRVLSIPTRPLPAIVADSERIFSSREVEVHIELAPNSEVLRARLAEGGADIAHAAVDNAVAMVEMSGSDVVILMGGENSANELIAQPYIHSIAELRGRILLVDAANTAYALQLKKLLLSSGLRAGHDYRLNAAGATPQRLDAMRQHNEYAASILGPPTSVIAKHEGFVSLGSTREMIGPYQAIGAFALRSWARRNPETLVNYLACYIEAERWLLDSVHKTSVLDLVRREWHLDAPAASETYALMEGSNWYQPDACLDEEGFRTVLRLRAEIEGQWNGRPPAPEKYCDFSYYQDALARLRAKAGQAAKRL
jgi:ABC-type nitrate/sulfonate/bicarbonate transport system substrate-binding protein